MIKYISIFLLFISCNGVQKKESLISNEQKVILRDTVVTYSLEGISTEGAEVKVNYNSGKISKSETIVYGEKGTAIIVYKFEDERIKVFETQYSYKTSFDNIESENDIKLTKEQIYYLDYNGSVIGDSIKDRIDIFKEFKDEIPFNIK